MDDSRSCLVCGTDLEGPYGPEAALVQTPAAAEGHLPEAVTAHAWICPGCGLVSWYVSREQLKGAGDESLEAQPGAPYERRTQMARLLRRVRRI